MASQSLLDKIVASFLWYLTVLRVGLFYPVHPSSVYMIHVLFMGVKSCPVSWLFCFNNVGVEQVKSIHALLNLFHGQRAIAQAAQGHVCDQIFALRYGQHSCTVLTCRKSSRHIIWILIVRPQVAADITPSQNQ